MPSIALVCCFFGKKWPSYFEYFLHSCQYNPSIDFIFFGNLSYHNPPQNVYFIHLDNLEAFNELSSNKLGFAVEVIEYYKLCDFKPAYGKIFEDYLLKYNFWGYTDIDLVYGNIRSFMTSQVLNRYDVIAAREEFPTGHFMLYRNIPSITMLFTQSKDYQCVFQEHRHFCFDECNFMIGPLYAGKSIYELNCEIESMAHILKNKERVLFRSNIIEFLHEDEHKLTWQNGSLVGDNTLKEYFYVHFYAIKDLPYFGITPFKPCSTFHINTNGISLKKSNNVSFGKIFRTQLSLFWQSLVLYRKAIEYTSLANKTYNGFGGTITFELIAKNKITVKNTNGSYEQYEVYPINTSSFRLKSTNSFIIVQLYFNKSVPFKLSMRFLRGKLLLFYLIH